MAERIRWRVRVEWGGEVFEDPDARVDLDEDVDITADAGGYQPRRLRIRIDLGDAWARQRDYHWRLARVAVWREPGAHIVSTAPAQAMQPGREGELSEIEVSERLLEDQSLIPPSFEAEVTYFDQAATAEATARAIAEAQEEQQEWLQGRPFVVPAIIDEGSVLVDPVIATRVIGATYPWVFGRPGESTGEPSSPAYLIDSGKVLIAGHRCRVGTVTLFGPDGSGGTASASRPIVHEQDASGRTVAVATFSSSADGIESDANARYFAAWDGTAEGLPGDAADVVAYLVGLCAGINLDRDSLLSLRGALTPYYLSGVVEREVSAYDLLVGEVLPLLPVAPIPSATGMRFVLRQWAAAQPSYHLTEGDGFARLGRWDYDSDRGEGPTTAWSLGYATSSTSRDGALVAIASARERGESIRAQAVYGRRDQQRQTGWVHRPATADRIVYDWLQRSAIQRASAEYLVDPYLYGPGGDAELRPGMIVRIADADFDIDGLAQVTGYRWSRGELRFRLLLLEGLP